MFRMRLWLLLKEMMDELKNKDSELKKLIARMNDDRAWLLQQIDLGRWPELRLDLATLERELGQLLTKISEKIE